MLDFVSGITVAYLGYVSAVVTGVAWPIAILAIAFAFRRRIAELTGKLEKLVFPGGEAHFHQGLIAAEVAAVETAVAIEALEPVQAAPVVKSATGSAAGKSHAAGVANCEISYALIDMEPSLAVNTLWTSIRGQIAAIEKRQPDLAGKPELTIVSSLRRQGLIPSEALSLYLRLAQLSTVARQGGTVSKDDGHRFVSTAQVLQRALQHAEEMLSAETKN